MVLNVFLFLSAFSVPEAWCGSWRAHTHKRFVVWRARNQQVLVFCFRVVDIGGVWVSVCKKCAQVWAGMKVEVDNPQLLDNLGRIGLPIGEHI